MKRSIALFLTLALLFTALPLTVFAANGDGNIDGGGGGMGEGTGSNTWTPGMDGVRVTVINSDTMQPVTTPIDLTNKQPSITVHFKKVSKIHYRNGQSISPTIDAYTYYNPATPMPRVISTDGNVNIEAIKSYFCSEYAIMLIAEKTGMSYNTLINGKYKLLLEPVAYFKHNDINYAMTAHEAALFDNQTSGGLRKTMASLTHKNQPFAMFLEYADLGFSAYSGATNKNTTNDTIIDCLGLGIVRFKPDIPVVTPTGYDYEYRCNTDVITSVTLYASGEINPDKPASVTFYINGGSYTVNNIVIPEGESQLVWVKWHTPFTSQDITITVSSTRGSLSLSVIRVQVQNLEISDPPDPQATDTKGSWAAVNIPNRTTKTTASWGVWSATWYPYWVWISDWYWHDKSYTDSKGNYVSDGDWIDNGYWKDQGWYNFTRNNYSASLSASMSIAPDDKVPTSYGFTMKSGYGVKNTVTATISTTAPIAHYSYAQTAISYFPEFRYETYWRILDRTTNGKTAGFEFANNIYSTYNRRTHFSPIWFPDGHYTVNTHIFDIWTPAGMLSANLSDYVNISGNLYADWHIAKLR